MSRPTTPYSQALGDREPLAALRATTDAIRTITAGWTLDDFGRSHAPGKWTAREVLLHLAHMELALGTRARMALTTDGYVAQPFEQDAWVVKERASAAAGPDIAAVFLGLAGLNLALFASLGAADRATTFVHPQFGEITVDWLIHLLAGHQLHHLGQVQAITTS